MDFPEERNISTKVTETSPGRIDRWLAGRFTYKSRNAWQEAIRSGAILVNGGVCRNSKVLSDGDIVSFLAEFEEPEVDRNFRIVYEDEYFYAVDKPGMLPCHPGGPYFKNTLWYMMSSRSAKVHFVNRLDRETSGLTIVAKSGEAASKISDVFLKGAVTKKYTVAVYGKFQGAFTASGWLVDDIESPVRKKRKFVPEMPENARDAEFCETSFGLIEHEKHFSLVDVELGTGRMHQIRAVLFSLGYPLVGDKLYGLDDRMFIRFTRGALTPKDKARLLLFRQALHSREISFVHPFTGAKLDLKTPPPFSLNDFSGLDTSV